MYAASICCRGTGKSRNTEIEEAVVHHFVESRLPHGSLSELILGDPSSISGILSVSGYLLVKQCVHQAIIPLVGVDRGT